MAPLLIGLLTFIMILTCLVLVLLVLIQLPKKEAGAGIAFGGAATDALFGAGSGTVLTKATKYSAGVFFALAILLSIMQRHYFRGGNTDEFRRQFESQSQQAPVTPHAATPTTTAPATTTPSTPMLISTNSAFPLSSGAGTSAPVEAPTNGSPQKK